MNRILNSSSLPTKNNHDIFKVADNIKLITSVFLNNNNFIIPDSIFLFPYNRHEVYIY